MKHVLDCIPKGQMSIFDFLKPANKPKEKLKPKTSNPRETYEVIKKEDMKVIYERNFVEICDDSRILISATVKFLEGNMIYFSRWYTYHFSEAAADEEKAKKLYEEKVNDILKEMDDKRFEVNVPVELKDMYLCQSGTWSEYTYAERNGAVRKG